MSKRNQYGANNSMYKHGKRGSKIYNVWRSLKKRCFNTNHRFYSNYGGRGITVQENWIDSFTNFYDYVSNLPNYDENNLGRIGLTLDRIDNDGNYEEGNLRWTTQSIQNRNQRLQKNNSTGFKGVTYTKKMGKYRSYIGIDRKEVHLGYYNTPEEAYQARVDYIIKNRLEGFEVELPSLRDQQIATTTTEALQRVHENIFEGFVNKIKDKWNN